MHYWGRITKQTQFYSRNYLSDAEVTVPLRVPASSDYYQNGTKCEHKRYASVDLVKNVEFLRHLPRSPKWSTLAYSLFYNHFIGIAGCSMNVKQP